MKLLPSANLIIFSFAISMALLAVILQGYIFIPLFVLLAGTSLFISKKIYHTYYSPLGVMGVTWILPPLLAFFNSRWELMVETWLAILVVFLFFVAGTLCAGHGSGLNYLRQAPDAPPQKIEFWSRQFLDRVIIILSVFGLAGFAINISHIIASGGIEFYIREGFRSFERVFGSNTIINYLYFLNMIVPSLVVLRTVAYGKNFFLILIGTISFLVLFFHGIKSTVIMATVVAFWVLVLAWRKLFVKHILAVGMIVFISFVLVSVGRDPQIFLSGDSQFTNLAHMGFDRIYHYIVPNYTNLQEELFYRKDYLMGQDTFSSLIELFSFRQIKPQIQYNLVDEAYNVGTYLRPFVVDFGLAGIVIGPLLIGFLTNYIFLLFLKRPTLFNLFFYAIAITVITFSFWSPQFLRIQFIYFVVVIYFIELFGRTFQKRKTALRLIE